MSKRIKGITIEIGAETTGLDKALKSVNDSARDIQKELREVDKLLKFSPGNTELVAQKQKLLGDQISTTKEKLDKLKQAEKEVQEQFKKGEISEEQYRAFQREIVETESKLKHYQKQLEATGASKSAFAKKIDEVSEKLSKAGDKMKSVGDKMKDIGGKMSKKVTAPIVAVGAVATKVGMDFEESMSKVAAVSGATGTDFEKLEAKAREMGRTTNKSASDAADAMGYMALAGWDTEKMLAGIEPMLKLSSAGNMELGRTAELVTNSMGSLGVEVGDLDKYLDVLAVTSQNADTDIDQLGEAFITAGGKLRSLGIDFNEGAVALGIMADAGIKGSEAGRGLSAILTNLTSPTGQAKKAIDELGLSFFDSKGNFIGVEESLKLVEDALSGMTQEQRTTYESMLAGKEHSKTFSALLNGLGEDFDKLSNNVENAKGSLDKMYDVMTDNLKGRLDNLTSALEDAGISVFKAMQPFLELLVGILTKLVNGFNKLPGPIQFTIVAIAGILAAIGPVIVVLGTLISTGGIVLTTLGKIGPVAGKLGGAFGKLSGVFSTISGFITTTLIPAIGAIGAPVWITIGVIGALIGIGVALYKNWDIVKEKATQLSEWIGIKWEEISKWTSEKWGKVKESVSSSWDSIKTNTSEKMESIKSTINEKWNNVKELTNQAWIGIKGKVNEHGGGIKGIIGTYGEAYKTILRSAWDYLNNITDGRLGSLAGKVRDKFNQVRGFIQNPMESAKNFVSQKLNQIKGFFSNLRLKFPKIEMPKLPKFSLTGKFSLNPPSVPKLNVTWNAKGAIFTKPYIFGNQGVGEAGPEAVLPIEKLAGMLSNTMKQLGYGKSSNKDTVEHTGKITIEGVNNKGEFVDSVEVVVKDILRKERRT